MKLSEFLAVLHKDQQVEVLDELAKCASGSAEYVLRYGAKSEDLDKSIKTAAAIGNTIVIDL